MKKLILFLVAVLACLGMNAQNVNVSGTVTSSLDGEPLAGVSVIAKGTSTGTSTDIDGHFSLSARPGSTLLFSYVGFTPQEVKVEGNTTGMNIVLIEDSAILDEVVVVGYGVQKKSVVTAAISQVGAETLA